MKVPQLLLLLFLALINTNCSSTKDSAAEPTPTPENPATRAARAEREFQSFHLDRAETRAAGRNAVIDFVKLEAPGWTVKGIASQAYEGNVFSMDADLERQGHRLVITFDVRKFFNESGDGYWLAVPVNKFRLDRLQALTNDELKKKLDETQSELDDAKSSPDDQ